MKFASRTSAPSGLTGSETRKALGVLRVDPRSPAVVTSYSNYAWSWPQPTNINRRLGRTKSCSRASRIASGSPTIPGVFLATWAPCLRNCEMTLHLTMLLTVIGRTDNACIANAHMVINCDNSTTISFGPIFSASRNSKYSMLLLPVRNLGFQLGHVLVSSLRISGGAGLPPLNPVEGATSRRDASSPEIATPTPMHLARTGPCSPSAEGLPLAT